ncbi:SprT family protein [Macrococcus equipercicus]|uniref:Protein SprT-like n=1 Tax=Macrococcus equipercicus TaxID=69967 RepID=A0ABQ6R7X9_9STAP|nr:SprT family protein [Macrococcus equipercicus]KAA1039218.1 SprT family protein [Macrococcus equipercicus]
MTEEELQQLVEAVSLEWFERPFRHTAVFNRRLRTTGGRYFLRTHNLEFNYRQYEAYGIETLTAIIKHELCHYHLHIEGKGYKHRDRDFKVLSSHVGAPRYCEALPEHHYSYEYHCVHCGQVYLRKRMIDLSRYSCGKCRGKLQLTRKV